MSNYIRWSFYGDMSHARTQSVRFVILHGIPPDILAQSAFYRAAQRCELSSRTSARAISRTKSTKVVDLNVYAVRRL